MLSGSGQVAPVGADRLQPGDHAFLAYSGDAERWEVLGIFTRYGLARNEKVYLNVDADCSPDETAACAVGGAAAAREALDSGQLVVPGTPWSGPGPFAPGRLEPGTFEPGTFEPGRLAATARQRLDDAAAEGFRGVRTASELSLAMAPADRPEQVIEYERALHKALRTRSADLGYTALCCWDGATEDTAIMEAVRAVHPVSVLTSSGMLHVAWMPDGIRLTGDSDLSTREQLTAALRALSETPPAGTPDQALVLDITDLSFLDAYSAGAILRLSADVPPPRRLEVRCRVQQRRLLHMLGGRSVPRLTIVTESLA